MTVSLIMVGHENIAEAFLNVAKVTLGDNLPLPISTVAFQADTDPKTLLTELTQRIKKSDQGEGVLILSDLYGATPCNIANTFVNEPNVRIVTGLNLPMLLRILNYPSLGLDDLTDKALEGGRSGVTHCTATTDTNT